MLELQVALVAICCHCGQFMRSMLQQVVKISSPKMGLKISQLHVPEREV